MKATIKVEKEVDVKTLEVRAQVRGWDDFTINGVEKAEDDSGEDIPCKKGELWCPIINIDTGRIMNWERGKTASVHSKVVDCCGWVLCDDKGKTIAAESDGYVPKTLCPAHNGYGDYIIMEIDADGVIQNWNFDIEDFIPEGHE